MEPQLVRLWSGGLSFKFRPIKSTIVSPTTRHRCNICSKGAVLPGRNDVELGTANLLHASAEYSEYNKRFDLIYLKKTVLIFTSTLFDNNISI